MRHHRRAKTAEAPRRPLSGWIRGNRLVAGLALAGMLGGNVLAANASSETHFQPAKRAALAGRTAIQWSGLAGFELSVPKDVSTEPSDVTLNVASNTSYALISFVTVKNGNRHVSGSLVYERNYAQTTLVGDHPPGKDYWRNLPLKLPKDDYELYMASDGQATLQLSAANIKGQKNYRANGKIVAKAGLLSASCPTSNVGCDPKSGYGEDSRYSFGGRRENIKNQGIVWEWAYAGNAKGGSVLDRRPKTMTICGYARELSDTNHPLGCDHDQRPIDITVNNLPIELENDVRDLEGEAFTLTGSGGPEMSLAISGWPGLTYLGFRASTVGLSEIQDARMGAYGFWYSYDIK
ncbi:MAG TPA: hypothetical protein VLG37_02025 [Candidatus Saccharimonadales bacterium]|nr:hypothetical protein [Candidatus Saccharimonadales bacterium]